MELQKRLDGFVQLGRFLNQFLNPTDKYVEKEKYQPYFDKLNHAVKTANHDNGWFTQDNVITALAAIAESLEESKLYLWISSYEKRLAGLRNPKRVRVMMAGNIPMVGFHDMLCVLMSGNIFIGKVSSQDKHLIPLLSEVLIFIEPQFSNFIFFTDRQLKEMDAIIATGSNNSSRYFDYYFGKYPHIIRKNRNSVAVLSGSETTDDLQRLGKDIFQYFGLGCRNVSKLFVPEGYDFDLFFKAMFPYKDIINHQKYANNYDYHKTIYLMNSVKLLDNNFLLLKEDIGLSSPVAVVYYEYYKNREVLEERLRMDSPYIQCIVSADAGNVISTVCFGETQCPQLTDYADGINTMQFLIGLN